MLTERQTQVFEDAAIGVTPGDRLHTAFGHFMAAVSAYGFLSHCECRLSFDNHGPYKTKRRARDARARARRPGRVRLPVDGRGRAGIEHNNLVIPVIMKDTHFNMVDDWGSFEATPHYDAANIVALGVYTSDYLVDGYIPVHMDSRTTSPTTSTTAREHMEEATTGMWKMMAGWTRDQMIDAGLLVYYGVHQGPRALRRRLRAGRVVHGRGARASASSRCSTTSTAAT